MRSRILLHKSKKGTILILVLWTLVVLTAFAVNIGVRVRQKVTLLSRLERRSQLRSIAFACIQKALVILQNDALMMQLKKEKPLQSKMERLNNPAQFEQIVLGEGYGEVSHRDYGNSQKQYGVNDEEGRININKAERPVLKRLVQAVLEMKEDEAESLANAIYDWRVYGESEIVGFFSDEYYDNLEFPYEEKKVNFETLDELQLIRGMTDTMYERLLPYITVYGDGKVNVNTASHPVLTALGLNATLAAKIIAVRRGGDGIEATADDVLFDDPGGVAGKLSQVAQLSSDDTAEIGDVLGKELLGTEGSYYRIHSEGHLNLSNEKKQILCVFDLKGNRVVYWREG